MGRERLFACLMLVSLAVFGCETPNTSSTDGGISNRDTGTVERPDSGSDAGPAGCTNDLECDDGVDCTEDTCNTAGTCRHAILPALCPAGSSCHPVRGCEMGNPCATDEDCADEDACTVNERCDPASRTCVVDPLDGDTDGDPPRVCGGGDCDDSNPNVYSGAAELCNRIDDDCNGAADEASDSEMCGADRTCNEGRCVCTGDLIECDGVCVDPMTTHAHCGSCGNDCGSDAACDSGACVCSGGLTFCDGACVDTQTDNAHCGACGFACSALDVTCEGGFCVCIEGLFICDGRCVDRQTDRQHCGACGRICESGTCDAGRCTWTSCPDPFTTCGGTTTCTFYDPLNCGGCGITCAPGERCIRGICNP